MTEAPAARELDITLERNSPVPLYHQLAQSIEHAINTGALSPGDRLENELSLTSRLGLSRPTARQAIQELVKKGMLVRKRGVGTQVVRSQFRRDERLSSFNEDLTKAGKVPGTRLLEYSVGSLDQDVRDAIDAEKVTDETFIKIRRLRLANDVPQPPDLDERLVGDLLGVDGISHVLVEAPDRVLQQPSARYLARLRQVFIEAAQAL